MFRVPNKAEAGNALLWRERDNAKECAMQICSSIGVGKEYDNATFIDRVRVLKEKHNYDWDTVSLIFKQGTYFKRMKVHYEGDEFPRYTIDTDYRSFSNSSIFDRNKRIFG